MKNLGELLESLLSKAKVDQNSQAFKDLFSHADLMKITIADDLSNSLENNLLTMDSAKANTLLKSHFAGQTYSGMDAELTRAMDEMGLDEDFKAKILAEQSTPKRAALLAKEVRELEKSKAAASSGDKKTLQDQINALNAEKANLVNAHKAEIEAVKAASENSMTDLLVKNTLSGYEYALGDIPKDVQIATANSLIQNELTKKGVKIVNENGNLKLLSAKEGTEYYEANKPVTYKDFVDQTLGQNKLLKTASAPNKEGNSSSGGGQKVIEPNPGQSTNRFDQNMVSALDAQINNLMPA